jgi:hypothetical protein
MADDTPNTAPPAAGISPDLLAQLGPLMQQFMPQMPQRDTTPVQRGWLSLLGEALGGGAPVAGMTDQEKETGGLRGLMGFGTGLMAASRYQPGQTVWSNLAQGFQGAQQGEVESAQMNMAQLGAQQDWAQKQQEIRLNALKEALPLLTLQQKQAMMGLPNPLTGSGGGVPGAIAVPGTDPIAALPKDQALAAIVARESGGKNIPTAILGPDGKPASTASGYYQMLDSTWQQAAALAGIKNPPARAMDASKADQDAAASALYDKRGYEPWAPSAPAKPVQFAGPGAPAGGPPAAASGPVVVPPSTSIAPAGGLPTPPIPPSGALPSQPTPVGNLGLVRNPDGAVGTPGGGFKAAPPTTGPTPAPTPAPVATTTPPATPTPQTPSQAQQPSTSAPLTTPPTDTRPDAALTFEEYRGRHAWQPTPDEKAGFTVTTDPQALADAERAKAAAAQQLQFARGGLGGDPNKSLSDYNTAAANVAKLQQEAQTSTVANQQNWYKNQNDTLAANYRQAQTNAAAATLKTQEGDQAVNLAKIQAGQHWRETMAENDAKTGTDQLGNLDEAAAGAANMQSILGLVGPQMKDLPTGLVAQTLADHPGMVNYLRAAHLLDGPTADATQLLQGLTAFMATEMKPKGLGPLRIQEMNAFQGSLPTLLQSDEGRQKAFAFINAYSQRIQQEADFAHNYFKRPVANDQPDAKPGTTMPARNLDGMWGAMGKTPDQGGLGSVLPTYTGGTSTANDAQAYAQWEQQQQAKPGNAYWQLRRNPKTGVREMNLATTPPAGG